MTTPDGNHALIIASSDIPMTDAVGSAALLERFEKAKAAALPQGARATLVSGHRFTDANATAVKGDLLFILPLSAAALGLILVLGIRSPRVLAVMAVPVAAFCAAGALSVPARGGLSGIVLGFGGVLMGIAVDFALHVFFALRGAGARAGEHLGEIARPIAFAALTSCAALGCLLLSDIPGIRQLAWFSMAGLAVAAVLSVTLLPLALPTGVPVAPAKARARLAAPSHPRLRIAAWLVLLAACAALAAHTRFNADLRALGHVPAHLAQDEEFTRQTWGGMRGFAVVFADGADLAQALEANEAVYARLRAQAPDAHVVSLAPMLPSPATQKANRLRWARFMDTRKGALLRALDQGAEERGFTESAFAPFRDFVASPGSPVTPERLEKLDVSFVTGLLLDRRPGSVTAMTLVPDTPAIAALFSPDVEQRLGVHLVSGSRFRLQLQQAMSRDVARFGLAALALVAGLVFLAFRDLRRSVAALAPVFSGLAAIAAALYATGGMNLFHVVSAPLVIGLSADYGIFMTLRRTSSLDMHTGRAVAVSGLTTLAGLGALSLATHPAMRSIGVTVLAGIGAAMATALLVTPALAGGRR
jgi:predicted exporter